jgi:hypothetical protein
MPKINSLSALLSSVNKTLDLARAIKDGAGASGGADNTLRMAELISNIVDTKFHAAEAGGLVQEKERRIAELEDLLDLKARLVRFEDAYYETDSGGERAGSPYCSRCWEVDHMAVHLTRAPLVNNWLCPQCKSHFTKSASG